MIRIDEDALICDLAETYGIFDYKSLPIRLVATFSVGLRDESRIKKKLCGRETDLETMLLAGTYDLLNLLVWAKTEDGRKNHNRPDSVVNRLIGIDKDTNNIQSFSSGEEFERLKNEILRGEG